MFYINPLLCLFVCLECGLTVQPTVMVMLRRSVYLTTLFPVQALNKHLLVLSAR